MTVVTGSASSGKSSLITTAFEQNEDAILINQKPVHVSNRSNLLTYLNIFEGVRLFLVNITGLKKSMFSTEKIFIFDEPTTGLHEDDLPILIECFNHLIDEGNTVILIEHNLTMMTEADWFIDIGLFAGEHGGQLLYAGDPKGLLNINNSVTAKHLRRYIE